MVDDELSKRRKPADAAPSPSAAGRRTSRSKTKAGEEKRPPLWRWFSMQVGHSDPLKSAAATHVKGRWDLPTTKFSKIDRSLSSEESEHLLAFRHLLEEYRVTFDVEDDDSTFAFEVGAAGALIPFSPEICEQCTRDAVPGTGRCARHGGQYISPKDYADMSRRIHDRVLSMSEAALRVLQDLMDNGRSEQVRALAATSILDRAGVGPSMSVNHSIDVTVSDADEAAASLRARLVRIQENVGLQNAQMLDRAAEIEAAAREDVVEAEVVEG